mgnify:CR=1 FL=1
MENRRGRRFRQDVLSETSETLFPILSSPGRGWSVGIRLLGEDANARGTVVGKGRLPPGIGEVAPEGRPILLEGESVRVLVFLHPVFREVTRRLEVLGPRIRLSPGSVMLHRSSEVPSVNGLG